MRPEFFSVKKMRREPGSHAMSTGKFKLPR
jgi:hypothetical protein